MKQGLWKCAAEKNAGGLPWEHLGRKKLIGLSVVVLGSFLK